MPGLCVDESPWSQPGGPPGVTPPFRTEPSPVAPSGKEGTIHSLYQATWTDLALLTSATHVSMLLNASIRDYINQDFQNGLERLLWLKALAVSVLELPEDTRPTSPDLDRFKSYNDNFDKAVVTSFRLLWSAAKRGTVIVFQLLC
jgi:hypothetical protein